MFDRRGVPRLPGILEPVYRTSFVNVPECGNRLRGSSENESSRVFKTNGVRIGVDPERKKSRETGKAMRHIP